MLERIQKTCQAPVFRLVLAQALVLLACLSTWGALFAGGGGASLLLWLVVLFLFILAALATIGQTVATLAHAIKNIIGGLDGGMFVVEKGSELDNKKYLHQGWGMVKGNVAKVKNLALELLSYSKQREPDYDLCDPNIPVREVFHLMRPRAQQNDVSLRLDLAEDLGRVYLDPEGIYCCILNLVTNAIDACMNLDSLNKPGEVAILSRKVDDWAVEYQVTDNGCGMDPQTRAMVFRSFFSTKGSKGTGLGLMITEKIIREHGGSIELESQAGRGSKFTIRLPRRSDGSLDSIPVVAETKDSTRRP